MFDNRTDMEWAIQQGIAANANGHTLRLPDEPDDASGSTPDFPETAWRGLFAGWRRTVGPTTEAPDVYHFFSFALAVGATQGRRTHVYHAVKLYPNFFVALVGRTGIARKDTARSRANDLMNQLHSKQSEENPSFILQDGIGSAEGLLECFSGDSKVVVAEEGELLSLMLKGKRDSTSNIIPIITTLYDTPDLKTLKTRSNPIVAKNTFLSILAGTTPVWLKRSLSEEHALSGFANRWMFVYGNPKAPMPNPPKTDPSQWDGIIKNVNEVRQWVDQGTGEIEISKPARGVFNEWYSHYYELVLGDGLLPVLAVRFQSFAWKLALLYAALEFSGTIEERHLSPALEVVEWLWHSNIAAFADFVPHGKELEDAILQKVKDGGGAITKRSLYRGLRITSTELDRHLGPMVRLGVLQSVDFPGANGRMVEGLCLQSL